MQRPFSLHLIGLVLCLAALAFAYFYLEKTLGFEPCPLCILDRFVFALWFQTEDDAREPIETEPGLSEAFDIELVSVKPAPANAA